MYGMNLRRTALSLAALCIVSFTCAPLQAAETGGAAAPKSGPRKVVAGVESRVPEDRKAEETIDPHDVVELTVGVPDLNWTPQAPENEATETLHYKATNTLFRRGVWQFQFSFRPLRMIRLDLPQPDGKMRRKVVWYMVYRITNPGHHMTPVQGSESKAAQFDAWHKGLYSIERVDKEGQMLANTGAHRFMPIFKLRSLDNDIKKEWLDQIVPLAKEPIFRREQPPCRLEDFHNTVEIAKNPIPLSTGRIDNSVWGYVTWVGGDPPRPEAMEIDPRIDYFSIDIWGLTNAYRWKDQPGVYKPGDPPGKGRTMEQKVLRLNYSRPGDEYLQREEEIKLGIKGQVDWEWIYR